MKRILFIICLHVGTTISMAEEQQDTVRMQELTVVATKETSPYRELPVAVSTLDARTLRDHQVLSIKQLSYMVPNFYMPDYGSRLTSAMYIRGVGSRINTPAVGLYVDDVPFLDKSGFDFDLGDIERIDVLRGPQGTLYGRNTLGGLVKVHSRSPLDYEGTDVHLGYSTRDNRRRLSATHYHHPTEKFAFSGGGYYEGSDGLFRNHLLDRKVDYSQSGGGRLRGIWLASRQLKFDAGLRFDHSHEGAYPYYYGGALNPAAEQYAAWKDKIANNREGKYHRNMLNASLNTEYRTDRFTLNSVTAYQFLRDRMFMDQDFLPDDIYTLTQRQRIHTLQEELTLKGQILDRWSGILGANVTYQKLRTEAPVVFESDGVAWLSQNINASLPDLTSKGLGAMSVTLKNTTLPMGGTFDTPTFNAAVFHQSSVELAPKLTLNLGVRLDYERNKMDYDAPGSVLFDFAMLGANPRNNVRLTDVLAEPVFRGTTKDDCLHFLPKAALQYDLGTVGNVYASVSRGSRSGGYNVQMFSDLLQTEMRGSMMRAIDAGTEAYLQQLFANVPSIPSFDPQAHIAMIMGRMREGMPVPPTPDVAMTTRYKPEYNWNYELGTHLATSDNRFMGDATVFLIDTRDQQIARFSTTGLGRMMVNAGESRSYGAELSLRALPDRHVSLALNYGYTHSEFRHYDAGGGTDYSGNTVPFAPRHTLSADAGYTFYFGRGQWKSLLLGATYSGAGRIYWNEANSASQDYYNLLSARAVLAVGLAQIELWGRNLTQTHYDTFCFESMGRIFSQRGRPLQVGVDVRLHF
ncbi:MAG: TonB-dependent receptor [Bacteroidaceae bacterium]|nr:TonB-dependent receptor [Bacteroidaceae bacterium]